MPTNQNAQGPLREPTQSELDLERAIELFDNALISNDERVINALRSLMMIVTLTAPETPETGETGPLRKLQTDVRNLNSRLMNIERSISNSSRPGISDYEQYKKAAMSIASKSPKSVGFNPIDLTYGVDSDILNKLRGYR